MSADPEAKAAPTNLARLNLATTVLGFLVSVVTGLWFTPFLLHALGPAAFGLIPLATTVVSYFSLLSQTLSSALTRSISIALAADDPDAAARTVGSALGGTLIVAGVLLVPLALLSWASPALFNLPPGAAGETRWLFAVVALSFLLSLVAIPFQAVAFSRNRLYFGNAAAIAQTLVRIGATVAFFAAAATIVNAGLAILLSGIVALVLHIIFARLSAPTLRHVGIGVDRTVLSDVSRTSSHVLLMQIGTVLTMSCELVIVNQLFGSYDAGRYAAAMQWLLLLRNATTALVVLCVPTILSLAAERRYEDLVDYTKRSMLWVGLATALPAGYLCGLSPAILAVWLGPDFASLWPIMLVQLAPLAVTAAVVPLYSITLATDRMLVAGLVQIGIAVVGIVAGVALGWAGGMAWVAAGVGWSFALKEILFMPGYAARTIDRPARTFLAPLGVAALAIVLVAGLSWGAGQLLRPQSILALGLVGVTVSLAYLGVLFLVARPMMLGAVQAMIGRRGAVR